MRGRWMPCAAIMAVLAGSQCGGATPPLTLIQDTLYKADGSRFDGIIQIEWKSFQAADGTVIPQQTLSVAVNSGNLRVELVPTTNALKPAFYTARFNSGGRTQFVEYWSVPPSAYPLHLADIRTQAALASNLSSSPIPIQDVAGLRTELDLRPGRGANWMTARAAVIGMSGGIDGAIGNPGDCVHVDGTSGPCGGGSTTSTLSYADADVPVGALDGVNTVFALTTAPAPAESLHLFRNGLLQRQGGDYTLTGNTITFAPGSAPAQGDLLQAWYRYGDAASTGIADIETPSGAINGVNPVFVLSAVPFPAASLQLYRNGLLQKQGADYSLSGQTITFVSSCIPGTGDAVQATYRK